jgi:hypothetical protein
VHFDADWKSVAGPLTRPKMSAAADEVEEVVNFGEVTGIVKSNW